MKAIVLEEPKRFVQSDISEPDPPGPGEAIVRVHRVGICGTDYSGYLGKMPFFSYPRIPGHELGVEVLELGEGVDNVSTGDRCSVEPYINNVDSFASQRGRGNCCENLQVLGVHTDGGMRPLFKLPARKLHTSASLEYEQLALVETLAIGCHCVDRAAPEVGENVVIIGAGPIGLSVIEFLKQANAKITVMDLVESRLQFCKETMGVDHTVQIEIGGDNAGKLRDTLGGVMPTIVIDATGNPASMSGAVDFVAHSGKLVYVGITTENVSFPHPKLHVRELTIMGSRNALPKDFGRIIKLIEDGQIDTKPWITHRTNFDDMIGEFDSFTRPETGVIKAILEVPAP